MFLSLGKLAINLSTNLGWKPFMTRWWPNHVHCYQPSSLQHSNWLNMTLYMKPAKFATNPIFGLILLQNFIVINKDASYWRLDFHRRFMAKVWRFTTKTRSFVTKKYALICNQRKPITLIQSQSNAFTQRKILKEDIFSLKYAKISLCEDFNLSTICCTEHNMIWGQQYENLKYFIWKTYCKRHTVIRVATMKHELDSAVFNHENQR